MSREGLIGTNVFLHAISSDEHAEECRRFLAALEGDLVRARLEPLVVHELTYALPRYVKQITRDQVAAVVVSVLDWPGILAEKELLLNAVDRWRRTPGLAFVDAYLASLSLRRMCPVYTKNVRELSAQGADVPDLLPVGNRG